MKTKCCGKKEKRFISIFNFLFLIRNDKGE